MCIGRIISSKHKEIELPKNDPMPRPKWLKPDAPIHPILIDRMADMVMDLQELVAHLNDPTKDRYNPDPEDRRGDIDSAATMVRGAEYAYWKLRAAGYRDRDKSLTEAEDDEMRPMEAEAGCAEIQRLRRRIAAQGKQQELFTATSGRSSSVLPSHAPDLEQEKETLHEREAA